MSQVEQTYAEVGLTKERFAMEDNECYGGLKVSPQKDVASRDGICNGSSSKVSNACKGRAEACKSRILLVIFWLIAGMFVTIILVTFILSVTAVVQNSNLNNEIAMLVEEINLQQMNYVSSLENHTQSNEAQQLIRSLNHSILSLKNQTELIQYQSNCTQQLIESLLNKTNHQTEKSQQMIGSLNFSLMSLENRIELIQDIIDITSSCAALPPSSPSGYYWVRASNGSAVRVYCDMTRSCGNITGRWMRVAELDMTNSSHQCPSGLIERTDSNIRTCVNTNFSASCSSTISTVNIGYTRVCGKVIGYQIGNPNAFARALNSSSSYYVDGVSLTHGSSRQHIWTFAAARDATTLNDLHSKCPCIVPNGIIPPPFVGNNYFCDTGSDTRSILNNQFFSNNPLWDGEGCMPPNTCCSFNTPPWFYRELPQPTTDDIEMRVCRDEVSAYEDIAIEMIEIYIQ